MRQRDRDAAAKVLEDAADLISKPGGWLRNAMTNDDETAFCTLGAMRKAATGSAIPSVASSKYYAAVSALASTITPDYVGEVDCHIVVCYNDDVAKDKRYVIRKMLKAARLLRKGELL